MDDGSGLIVPVSIRPSAADDSAFVRAGREAESRRFLGDGAPDPRHAFCVVVYGEAPSRGRGRRRGVTGRVPAPFGAPCGMGTCANMRCAFCVTYWALRGQTNGPISRVLADAASRDLGPGDHLCWNRWSGRFIRSLCPATKPAWPVGTSCFQP